MGCPYAEIASLKEKIDSNLAEVDRRLKIARRLNCVAFVILGVGLLLYVLYLSR